MSPATEAVASTSLLSADRLAVSIDGTTFEARFELMQYYAFAPRFLGGGTDKEVAQAAAIAEFGLAPGHLALDEIAKPHNDRSAKSEFRTALSLAPDDPHVRQALVSLLSGQRRWRDIRGLHADVTAGGSRDARVLCQFEKPAALSGEGFGLGLNRVDRFVILPNHPFEIPEYDAHWRRA